MHSGLARSTTGQMDATRHGPCITEHQGCIVTEACCLFLVPSSESIDVVEMVAVCKALATSQMVATRHGPCITEHQGRIVTEACCLFLVPTSKGIDVVEMIAVFKALAWLRQVEATPPKSQPSVIGQAEQSRS